MFTIQRHNEGTLSASLSQAQAAISPPQMTLRLGRAAQVLVVAAKQEAPVNTGTLQRSIEEGPVTSSGSEQFKVEVTVPVPYAAYVKEKGTGNSQLNLYMERAVDKTSDQVNQILTDYPIYG